MAIGTAAALLGSAVIGAGSSIYGANKASKSAREAAALQQAGIERGINESQPYYAEGQNYLAPYVNSGATYSKLLNDIVGVNGPEAQAAALQMYKSSPSATLLNDSLSEASRQTMGQFAANGSANSGAMTTELAKRLSDLNLANYYQWQNLPQGMFNTSANASGAAANLANSRGQQIIGARTGQGTAAASGEIGSANAQLAGLNASTNYLTNLLGRAGTMDLSGSINGTRPAAPSGPYGSYGNSWQPVIT